MAYQRELVLLASLLTLSACFGDPVDERDVPARAPVATASSSGSAVEITVQRLLGSNPSSLPFISNDLPHHVPSADARLPSLLDDPPGRALMTYHHPEGAADATGWASEDVLFYGTDRRWRRLRMMDLGLPESTWPEGDTYGAGRLSPDGRWWAAGSTVGTVLVDMVSGRARVIELRGLHRVPAKWLPDSRGFITTPFAPTAKPRTFRVSIPDGDITRVPHQYVDVGFARDGSPITLDRGARHKSVMVKWVGKERMELGPVDALPLRGSTAGAAVHTAGRLAFFEGKEDAGVYDVVVVSSFSGASKRGCAIP